MAQAQHIRVQVTTAEAAELKAELETQLLAAVQDFENTTGLQIADIALGKVELTANRIATHEVKITALL